MNMAMCRGSICICNSLVGTRHVWKTDLVNGSLFILLLFDVVRRHWIGQKDIFRSLVYMHVSIQNRTKNYCFRLFQLTHYYLKDDDRTHLILRPFCLVQWASHHHHPRIWCSLLFQTSTCTVTTLEAYFYLPMRYPGSWRPHGRVSKSVQFPVKHHGEYFYLSIQSQTNGERCKKHLRIDTIRTIRCDEQDVDSQRNNIQRGRFHHDLHDLVVWIRRKA